MRFLIAGLGSIGRRHLRNLQALDQKDIVLYRTRRSTLPEEDLAGLTTETSLEAALARKPDAAIISNPTALHVPTGLMCARAGVHLLMEKPIADTLDGVDALKQAVQARNLRVLVGFQFRFHPGLVALKRLIDEGRIGRILSARAHYAEFLPGCHPWEDYRAGYGAQAQLGGGVLLTFCHPLDYLRWLLGEVDAVSAVIGRESGLDLNVEDTADLTLVFESGAVASVHLDYIQRPPSHRLELTGQNGRIEWDNADGSLRWFSADRGAWEVIPAPEKFERNVMFLQEMRHFLDCVSGKAEPVATLEDGVRVTQIVLAAKQAAAAGQTVKVDYGRSSQAVRSA